jgi:ubiquinol-cytochrome c reductase cytochrome c subunit
MKIGCNQCHGNEGHGGAAGPRLGPAPMLAFRAFANYVRAPRGEMPPYTAKVLSDQELADMYAFLVERARPPALNTIPLLQP